MWLRPAFSPSTVGEQIEADDIEAGERCGLGEREADIAQPDDHRFQGRILNLIGARSARAYLHYPPKDSRVRPTPLPDRRLQPPEKVRQLVDRLRTFAPPLVMIVVDGPKPGDAADEQRVQAVRDAAGAIDWKCEVRTRFVRSTSDFARPWSTR